MQFEIKEFHNIFFSVIIDLLILQNKSAVNICQTEFCGNKGHIRLIILIKTTASQKTVNPQNIELYFYRLNIDNRHIYMFQS